MCVLVADYLCCKVAGLDTGSVLVAKKKKKEMLRKEVACVDYAYFVDASTVEKCLSALRWSSHKANSGMCSFHN